MDKPHKIPPDVEVLPAHFSRPGAGLLAINAFVIKAKEPVLLSLALSSGNGKGGDVPGSARKHPVLHAARRSLSGRAGARF